MRGPRLVDDVEFQAESLEVAVLWRVPMQEASVTSLGFTEQRLLTQLVKVKILPCLHLSPLNKDLSVTLEMHDQTL